MIDQFVYFGS